MNEAIRVRFVRSGASGGGVVQVWRSDVTRRQYEVSEADAYAPAARLAAGDIGYLSFLEGTPIVTKQPLSRGERLKRLERLRSRHRGQQPEPAPQDGGSRMLLLVVGILVLVLLWALL